MIGTVAKSTLEARALANGWKVVRARGASALLECTECGARIEAKLTHQRVCRHPAVDEARGYLDDLVCRRFVRDFGAMSLQEVGDAMQVSRERVRQIEAKALRRLRQACKAEGWTEEEVRDLLAYLDRLRPEHAEDKADGWTREDWIRYQRRRTAAARARVDGRFAKGDS